MTQHSVTGISDVLKNYSKFKRLFDQLFALAVSREPHAIICVDFSGFNRRFAAAVRSYVRARQRTFNNWEPKIHPIRLAPGLGLPPRPRSIK